MSNDKLDVVSSFKTMSLELAKIKEALTIDDIALSSAKYSDFKEKISTLKLSLEGKKLNSYQRNFLLPAVSEILSSSLIANKGSRNKTNIGRSVSDADDYVAYWLSELE